MSSHGPQADQYCADDRSLLLPYYKRWLIEPAIAKLPCTLSPNAITHVGHLLNLSALLLLLSTWPKRGPLLIVAALLMQLYIWCDNADGAHARRTGQCSAYGELLDHGLDVLNVAYIACIAAIALGLEPLIWVLLVLLVTAASAVTFWEQTTTGVFHLGRLNQLESGVVLSVVLTASALLGTDWWATTSLLGVSARWLMVAVCSAPMLIGMVKAIARVMRVRRLSSLLPIGVLGLFDIGVLAATALGSISARVAVALVLSGNVFFAIRMLAHRICKHAHYRRLGTPRMERALVAAIAGLGVMAAAKLALAKAVPAHGATPHLDTALAVFAVTIFAVCVIRDARRGILQARS